MSIFRPPLHAVADALDLTVELTGALALLAATAVTAIMAHTQPSSTLVGARPFVGSRHVDQGIFGYEIRRCAVS